MDSVSIDANQVVARMNQLSLFFEKAADLGKPGTSDRASSGNAGSPPGRFPAETPARPGMLAGWVGQPDSSAGLRAPVARARPELSGDSVSAKLLITPAGMETKDVSIDGDVRVKHQLSVGEALLPIEMIGETMRLQRSAVSQASGQDYLQLGGGPETAAELKMGDGFFRGPMIKVAPMSFKSPEPVNCRFPVKCSRNAKRNKTPGRPSALPAWIGFHRPTVVGVGRCNLTVRWRCCLAVCKLIPNSSAVRRHG
jgi:hypothetical protein